MDAKAGEKEDPKGHTIKQEYEIRRNSVSKVSVSSLCKEKQDAEWITF